MLGISSVGWTDEEEIQILNANAGSFSVLEIVPARIFAKNKDYADIAKEYRDKYGLWTYSAQALFFQSNVQSFEDTTGVFEHLAKVVNLAPFMNIKRFVLGSPNLRKGSQSCLMNSLKRMDEILEANGATLCIEPVAKCYGGSYFFTIDEIVNSIDFYGLRNVKTMVDTNNAWLQRDSPRKALNHYFPYIAHVHISDTNNGPLLSKYEHVKVKETLDNVNYEGAIVYELFQAKKNMSNYRLFKDIYT